MSQNQAPGNNNGGTCYGDSGGPNFWVQPDGSEVLRCHVPMQAAQA